MEHPPKNQYVPWMVIDVCMMLYVLVTINSAIQFAMVARLVHSPRACVGNISDMISQGTGAQAKAKNKLNKTVQTKESRFTKHWYYEEKFDRVSTNDVNCNNIIMYKISK